MKTEHTPTPRYTVMYGMKSTDENQFDTPALLAAGERVATFYNGCECEAAVRAMNSHDALIEAGKLMLDKCKGQSLTIGQARAFNVLSNAIKAAGVEL